MRYIDADKLIKTLFPIGLIDDGKYTINAKAVKYAIDNTPTADVAPKSEVAKEALLELKKQIHDKAVYTNSQDVANYVQLKVFDAVLNNVIKKYTEGDKDA